MSDGCGQQTGGKIDKRGVRKKSSFWSDEGKNNNNNNNNNSQIYEFLVNFIPLSLLFSQHLGRIKDF